MQPITCDACHQPAPAHGAVNCGSMEGIFRQFCSRSFNKAAARRLGLQGFEQVDFEPVRMVDDERDKLPREILETHALLRAVDAESVDELRNEFYDGDNLRRIAPTCSSWPAIWKSRCPRR